LVKDIYQQYLQALDEGSLKKVLSLFDDNAVVVSPLYGEMSAKTFYQELFADTTRSKTNLLNIFDSVSKKSSVALHFHYSWTLRSGKVVEFDCVDIFELTPDKDKIIKLEIIYDTAPIRADFDDCQT
jgi:ketosteroid isomerase-like protein